MSEVITLPEVETEVKEKPKVRRQPPYNVILHDDDDHTFEYVIVMLNQLFGYPPEKGYQLAEEVHLNGRVIVLTTFNLDDRAAAAIRHGASGFLLKGTTPAMLGGAIRTVHAGNAVLGPQDLATLLDGQFRTQTPPPASYLTLTEKEREVFQAPSAVTA